MNAISIGSRRELFWDDFLIDAGRTTATSKSHHPQSQEVVMVHNAPWEGDGCGYHSILRDGDLYRMYYLARETLNADGSKLASSKNMVAYAESRDGLRWTKPNLGLCEHSGSRDNNIILDTSFDNFYVFKDQNPVCPPEELYKGVTLVKGSLWCFTGADGIRFTKAWPMTDEGNFDSLNIALWNRHTSRYMCYIRNTHKPSGADFVAGEDFWSGIRDVRWMESDDFKNWTKPKLLDFGEAPDYPLYTNVVQPYYRADHMFIGFPSRYIERKEWSPNFDQLPGKERRQKRMGIKARLGLAVTDCVFICSHDGKKWKRWDEAFMRPGPERDYNWVYGDCYPAVGMIETPSRLPGAPVELSMYIPENHWGQIPKELRRYTMRVDGFASYHATYQPKRLVTKPFVFEGRELSLNFATSAAGYVKIKLSGDGVTRTSCELFGDTLDRRVVFKDGDISRLEGKPVIMEMDMSDANVYSFRFTP